MLPALKAALADRRPGDTRFLRQVVFLTDGQIGDEAELLEAMGAGRGRSRVFMVGIGSAPNSYLMSRAAEIGRGAFTHIGSPEEVEADMRALFEKLESPAAVALEAEFDGVKVKRGDIAPAVLPDLYVGEPLLLVARVSARRGVLRLRATVDGRPWEIALPLADATPGQGLSKLWARRRITDVEVARSLGRLEYEAADAQLLELALEHHLVTEVTSLVAVDRTPKRPADAPLTRAEVPINLPAGWDFDTIFGHVAGDRSARAEAAQGAESVDLPQTATDAGLRLRLGLLLGAVAPALAWAFGRRRRTPAERRA
jgi:Ca-activated chloride channel family protein